MTSTTEALPRKKIGPDHWASATRLLNQIDGILANDDSDGDKFALLKLSLKQKLDIAGLRDCGGDAKR